MSANRILIAIILSILTLSVCQAQQKTLASDSVLLFSYSSAIIFARPLKFNDVNKPNTKMNLKFGKWHKVDRERIEGTLLFVDSISCNPTDTLTPHDLDGTIRFSILWYKGGEPLMFTISYLADGTNHGAPALYIEGMHYPCTQYRISAILRLFYEYLPKNPYYDYRNFE